MSRRIVLFLALACFVLRCSSMADGNEPLEKEIAALSLLPRDMVRAIQLWDGEVVVSGFNETPPAYYKIKDFKAEKLIVPGLDRIRSLACANGRAVAYGTLANVPRLLCKEGGAFAEIALPAELKMNYADWQHDESAEVFSSDAGIAIANEGKLYQYKDSRWNAVILSKSRALNGAGPPARYLYGSQLFEISGFEVMNPFWSFRVFDVDRHERGWRENGGPVPSGGNSSFGMTVDASGKLWFCAGRPGGWGGLTGLYRYDGKQWQSMLTGDSSHDGVEKIRLPEEHADIADVFAGPDGKLYLLINQLGIFLCEETKLSPVVEIHFDEIPKFRVGQKGNSADYLAPCYLNKLVTDGSGNFFVTALGYGVLGFAKDGQGYQVRQIVIPASKE